MRLGLGSGSRRRRRWRKGEEGGGRREEALKQARVGLGLGFGTWDVVLVAGHAPAGRRDRRWMDGGQLDGWD
jgi:hypothetical protein